MRRLGDRHRLGGALLLASAVVGLLLLGAGRASAATLNVCESGCPYTELAPALAAAHDGDRINIGRGTYAGGVTIDVSVTLVGAGAGSTIISGGGPVVTIGTFGASSEPTVSIEGVTITRGVTRSSPESTPFTGEEGVLALGGGIEIPPNGDFTGGATVTIRNSSITGNRAAPTATVPSGPPCPGGDPCPVAWAKGGGIDSWGRLTLDHTTVSNNRIGSASGLSTLASDAQGGGIISWLDALTIRHSVISRNVASAAAPNGRFAEGGGIWVESAPAVKISDSSVTNNRAVLNAALPASVELAAQPGGVFIGEVARATITSTTIAGNSAAMTNTVGDATAFAGGINVQPDVDLQMTDSVVADNTVSSATLSGSRGNAEGDTGGGALLGTITDTRITGNTVTVSAARGDALAGIGGLLQFGTLAHSLVSDNHLRASGPRGSAEVMGVGVMVAEHPLTLRNTTVSGNTGVASGLRGFARGGGIYDGPFLDIPGSPLALVNSSVTGNALTGSAAITLQGGGVYLRDQPLASTNSVIANNSPDQCFGC